MFMNSQKKNKKMNIQKNNKMFRLIIILTLIIYTMKTMYIQINNMKKKTILMRKVMIHKTIMMIQMMKHTKSKNWMNTMKKLPGHLEL